MIARFLNTVRHTPWSSALFIATVILAYPSPLIGLETALRGWLHRPV